MVYRTQNEFVIPEVEENEFAQEVEQVTPPPTTFMQRQATYAAMTLPDPRDTFDRVMNEYYNSRESATVETIRSIGKQAEMQYDFREARDVILEASPDTLDETESRLSEIRERGNINPPSIKEMALRNAALAEETESAGEEDAHFASVERFFEIVDGRATSDGRILAAIDANTPVELDAGSGLRQGFDLLRTALIPGSQVRLSNAIDNAAPGILDTSDFLFTGNAIRKWQKYVLDLPTAEQQEQAVEDLAYAVREMADLLGENNFDAWLFWTGLTSDILEERDGIDFTKWLENVFGVLDTLPLLSTPSRALARGLRRGVGRFAMPRARRSAQVESVGQVAPRASKKAVEAAKQGALQDMRVLGEDLGVIEYEHNMPKQNGDEIRNGFDLSPDYNIEADPILSTDFGSANFRVTEMARAQQNYVDRIHTIFGGLDDTMHMSKTTVEDIPGGFSVNFMLGHTSTAGFSSIKAAEAAAKRYREVQNGAETQVFIRDYANGTLRPYRKGMKVQGKREYYVSVKDEYYYSKKDFDFLGDNFFVGATGLKAEYFDKSSLFESWFVNATNATADQSSAILKRLVDIRAPLIRLPSEKFNKAMKIIEDNEREAIGWFTPDAAIRQADGDLELAQGVLAHQRHARAMLQLENRKLYQNLAGQDMRRIDIATPNAGPLKEGNPAAYIGKPIAPNRLNVEYTGNRIYDPEADKVVEMSPGRIRELMEAEGVQVLKIEGNYVRVGKDQTSFVLLRNQSNTVKVGPLPRQLIRDVPGYVSRIYDANFVVGRETSVIRNGKPHTAFIPRAFARTKADADAELELQIENRPKEHNASEYVVRESRELRDYDLSDSYAKRQSIDYYHDSGRLFTSGRGELLSPLREGGVDGRHGLVPILQAMETAERKAANQASRGQATQLAIQRWEKEFGEKYGDQGRMPLGGRLKRPAKGFDPDEMARANALRDHILLISGVNNSQLRAHLKNWTLGHAQKFLTAERDSLIGRIDDKWKAGDRLVDMAKTASLTDSIKRASFLYHIVISPIRQALLQATQMTLYLSVPFSRGYVVNPNRYTTDLVNVVSRLAIGERVGTEWDDALKQLPGEYREQERLYNGLRRTGLLQSIDTHSYAAGFAADIEAAAAKGQDFLNMQGQRLTWTNAPKFAALALRRAGFDLGENIQLMHAFLFERNRWMRENPKIADQWDTDINLAQISGNARQLSGNMNSSGALAIQRGLLSIPFQFMSHTMKMAQILLPNEAKIFGKKIPGITYAYGKTLGKLSNKYYTDTMRGNILLTQMAIWGTGWLGLTNLLEDTAEKAAAATGKPFEIPEDARMIAREGAFGTLFNVGLRMMNGEPAFESLNMDDEELSDLIVSGSIAPFSGIAGMAPDPRALASHPMTKIYEAIFFGGDWREWAGGAPLSAAQNIMRKMDHVFAAAGATAGLEETLLSDPEKAGPYMLDQIARIAPAYDRWARARGVARGYEWFYNEQGERTVRGTEGEAWAKTLFGFQTAQERKVNDMLYSDQALVEMVARPSNKQVDDLAKQVYERVLDYARFLEDGTIDEYKMWELASVEHFWAQKMILNDPVDVERFQKAFKDRVFSDLNDTSEARLIERLRRGLPSGAIKTLPESITEIQNGPDWPGKEEFIEYMKDASRYYDG